VLEYLDFLSPEVRSVRACNTVAVRRGRWHGYNTDIYGFLKGLEEKRFRPEGVDAAVIGAGGAARAVIYALIRRKARSIVILNRTRSKAKKLAAAFSRLGPRTSLEAARLSPDNVRRLLKGRRLIVNATRLGLGPHDPPPVETASFPKAARGALCYDLIYSARKTPFLSAAERRGYRTQDGRAMLLHQGAKAFRIWTGRTAPLGAMRRALSESHG
jgi:shikimate dehydrogenase